MLTPRQRDRRQALPDLFAALARALDRHADISLMRGVFEQAIRRIVPVQTIQLRDANSRWSDRSRPSSGCESIALPVPGADAATKGVLEATFDPGCALGDWDFQMLALAAHVGALVLEIERNRLRPARLSPGEGIRRTKGDPATPMIGSAPAMQELRSSIERVAATDFVVLLEGETGVGKELVARQIHDGSRRRHGPFVAINCAALVETLLEAELFGIEERTATGVRGRRGKFESAEGGTLFLDEVGDLSASAQAKLLRAIQDLSVERVGANGAHRVDIRVVAATNRSLATMVARGLFRPDLYYRLSGVDLRVPPLRERRSDIPELAEYFLATHRATRLLRLSDSAMQALVAYEWPGNVRQLERVIEHTVALVQHDTIQLDDLPATVRGEYASAIVPSLERDDTLRVWARRYARLILDRCQGNKREACRVLGISYHTLQAYVRPSAPGSSDEAADPADRQDESEVICYENQLPGASG